MEEINMCGIIAYTGKRQAVDMLLAGLFHLEYRGYDSSGIAVLGKNKIELRKKKGKVEELKKSILCHPLPKSTIGIGHTRWATHGVPNEINCHPHQIGNITLVHNGIIENYKTLKNSLEKQGYVFVSDTDSEVAAACLDACYKEERHALKAMAKAYQLLEGSFAFAILFEDHKEAIYAMRKHSPLVIGHGEDENFVASDISAFLQFSKKFITLQHEELAEIKKDNVHVYNLELKEVYKEPEISLLDANGVQKNNYDHFMLKEIHEEPQVVKDTIHSIMPNDVSDLSNAFPNLEKFNNIHIVGCGSAMYAGMVAKYMIEQYVRIRCECYCASEYRYQTPIYDENTLAVFISQSGETADTLAALRKVKKYGVKTYAIVNVIGSALSKEADHVIYTQAGKEVSVATTKAYCSQLCILSLMTIHLALLHNKLSSEDLKEIKEELSLLPDYIEKMIDYPYYETLAQQISTHDNVFFIGRGIDYILSLEGSLKLKEISYIHSEAYPAGELKHGTISLIEDKTPVIALVNEERLYEKTMSNIKEVKARGANVLLFVKDMRNISEDVYDECFLLPSLSKFLQGIVSIVPLQMLAYTCAKQRGCEIDQPRNLAKSVTVE